MSLQLQAPQRATPTGVVLMTAEQIRDRRRWRDERRKGVGSSDVAAVVGVADYKTAVHVWLDKRDVIEDEAGEAALWGTLLEDTVAQEWCRRNRSVIHDMGLIANQDEPWMRASLDRQVSECPLDPKRRQVCALEVKCRSAFKSARWHRDVPDDVLAQTAWQMAVSGYDHIHVAVLIGGNDYRQTVVRRDEKLERYLTVEAEYFWKVNVGQGIQPAWDLTHADQLLALDEQLYPTRSGECTVDEIGDVLEYATLSRAANDAEKARKAGAARLRQIAGGHEVVTFADEVAFKVSPRSRSNVDLAVLAERWPDAYAACVSDTHFHQIELAKQYKAGAAS